MLATAGYRSLVAHLHDPLDNTGRLVYSVAVAPWQAACRTPSPRNRGETERREWRPVSRDNHGTPAEAGGMGGWHGPRAPHVLAARSVFVRETRSAACACLNRPGVRGQSPRSHDWRLP